MGLYQTKKFLMEEVIIKMKVNLTHQKENGKPNKKWKEELGIS